MTRLPPSFFARKTAVVAKDLLGRKLVRRHQGKHLSHVITETEAYLGPHDLACHAAKGRTIRTEPLYGPPGTLYIYLIYGIHWMLNVVTEETDHPSGVLIRGVEEIAGPGRLTKALDISQSLNARPASQQTGLWFEDSSRPMASPKILATPRIGVDYAGPVWAKKKLRFVLGKPAERKSPKRDP